MELRKETFHDGTLLCQYQSVVKSTDDEEGSDGDGDDSDDLEPERDDDGEEEDRQDDEGQDSEEDEDEEDDDDADDGEEDDEDEEEENEEDEDENEKDEECDPNDKFEKRAGARLNRQRSLQGREDNSKQSGGYTVEYDCVYDVATGNLLEDQAKSCPPVVSSSC
ncbi:hypothetical protein FB107DRAFT_274665 [Schizophyllum commune]